MSKQIKLIDSREVLGKQFNIYGDFENPLFLAKDVAGWIEYSDGNVSHMCSMLDEDDVIKIFCEICESNNGTKPIKSSGFANRLFVNEDGLYEILMQSRKPIAKEFKKQVKEILRTIRKTGGYIANTQTFVNTYFSSMRDEDKQFLIQTLDSKLIAEKELEKAKKELIIKEEIIEVQKPKVDYYNKILADKTSLLTTTQIAKDYDLSAVKLNKILNKEKFVYKSGGQWLLYSNHTGNGYMKSVTQEINGVARTYSKFTQNGRLKIHKILENLGINAVES